MESDLSYIIVIGLAGTGKSTIANKFIGRDEFKEFSDFSGGTKDTFTTKGTFGSLKTYVIDTPGLDDQEGKDAQHIIKMVQIIKQLPHVHAIVITFNFN